MQTIRKLSVALASCVLFSASAFAADLILISHKGVSVATADARDIFVGDKQVEGGTKLVPVDNASLQKDFLEKVVKVDSAKYSSIWAKKGFREGLNPPPMKNSDAEVIAFVKANPGAVGYVSKATDDVKVVHKF
ncbi:phosphate ABC transporter substrate-binding protein [Undibacterium sp. LX40W]|uniref:Phosphate ABC transporter substrate-binding protein n=1 Tax=Undibacterium nitidum TaxID=2762298 RepID=A0A923KKF8_9BURK|nr:MULTISPECIES: phosphate ABC transporter substrate-binding protein [Undibacterium]MBC3880755.1 phosphate ABC transporter substrate-binding protein [Undibacterium nitidum]MBC3890512.1 phosphate ABC transporter substrate-binding protein [Undibacterium sp. LX40W]